MKAPPVGITDTGFGMMFAFERSVVAAGVVEQATVINAAAATIVAMIVFSVFKGVSFSVYTGYLFVSSGNRRLKANDFS